MKRLLFILMLFPVLAAAEHHRGHVVTHITEAVIATDTGLRWAKSLSSCNEWDPVRLNRLNQLIMYLENTLADLGSVEQAVLEGRLDDARGYLNQPQIDTFLENGLGDNRSAARQIKAANERAAWLLQGPEPCTVEPWSIYNSVSGKLYIVQIYIGLAWQRIDLAIWHLQDAIREEVYFDYRFYCSGPNNHCGE